MPLPTTGPISFGDVREELGRSSGPISLGDADVRALAGVSSGAISMSDLRGKSSDYGITLPSSIDMSATSTNSVSCVLTFNVEGGNEVGWLDGSGTKRYIWNEHSLPKDSYEVRLVHVSGSIPSSGAEVQVWLPATLTGSQLTWRWARSTPGTTTGSFRLEIRNKFSQQVIASCPVSVNVVYQVAYSQHTMPYARWLVADDKVSFYYQGYNGLSGHGSLSPPNTIGGATIARLDYVEGLSVVTIVMTGSRAKNFFSRMEVVGVGSFYTADVPVQGGMNPWGYFIGDGGTYWQWPNIQTSPFGTARTIRIHP